MHGNNKRSQSQGNNQPTIRQYMNAPQVASSSSYDSMKRKRTDDKIHRQGNAVPRLRTPTIHNSSVPYNDSSQQQLNATFENGRKLDYLLDGFKDFNQRFLNVETRVTANEGNLADVDRRINMLEQKSLNSRMEISGLNHPSFNPSTMKTGVFQYIVHLGIEISENQITDAFQVNRKYGNVTRSIIIVEFLHESIKKRIMREKIQHDKQQQIAPTIFFSDVLTKMNRHIFMEARQLKKQKLIHSAWTIGGEIYIRQSENQNKIKVFDLNHLRQCCSEYNDEDSVCSEYEAVMNQRRNENNQPLSHQHGETRSEQSRSSQHTQHSQQPPQTSMFQLSNPKLLSSKSSTNGVTNNLVRNLTSSHSIRQSNNSSIMTPINTPTQHEDMQFDFTQVNSETPIVDVSTRSEVQLEP